MKKFLIIGHARHGKDTVAEILKQYFGMRYISSSEAAAKIFIYDALKEKYNYRTIEECFNDRVNHREEWYNLIVDYNKNDKSRLASEIVNSSDCYVGMRDLEEIKACRKIFDLIIWVDASNRLPKEDSKSFNIDPSCADIIISNNDSYEDLEQRVKNIGKFMFPYVD